MKKVLSLILALVLCLSLCACDQDATESHEAYEDLIDAIESNNYDRALRELQDLMGIEPEQPPAQQTVPSSCTHSGPAADCISDSYCNHCGELLAKALGHDYVDGECTRCKSTDPEMAQMIKDYNTLVANIGEYERNGAFFANNKSLYGSDAVGYLYDELTRMGDFRDCAQYLERITVLPDRLLYIKLLETDNLGNIINSTNIDYEYDRYGRVTMSEHNEFKLQLGMFGNSYSHGESQSHVTITYGDDNRISEYRTYYVMLTGIAIPAYDENGRIASVLFKHNDGENTRYLSYDEEGRLTQVQYADGDILRLLYNPDGTLASRIMGYAEDGVLDDIREYFYDENGHMTGWKDNFQTTTVTCDSQGRILQEIAVKDGSTTVYDYVYGNWYAYSNPNSGA